MRYIVETRMRVRVIVHACTIVIIHASSTAMIHARIAVIGYYNVT